MSTPQAKVSAPPRSAEVVERFLGPVQRAGIMLAALFGGIPLGCGPRPPGGWYLVIATYSALSAGLPVPCHSLTA